MTVKSGRLVQDLRALRWKNFPLLALAGCVNAFGVTIHQIDPRAFMTISEVADVFKNNDR